jgi:phosphoribosyl-AMP cyclohydrolase
MRRLACATAFAHRRMMTQAIDQDREQGGALDPRFDAAGLITAVVTDHVSGDVLMLAHMNAEALAATLASGEATFYSRSRGRLWKKGETSGNVMRVVEARIDCDQDAVWLRCEPAGPACHTGEASCFYRRIDPEKKALVRILPRPE